MSSGGESERDDVSLHNFSDDDGDDNGTDQRYHTNHGFVTNLSLLRRHFPVKELHAFGDFPHIQSMTDKDWVQCGRDISNNCYLDTLSVREGVLDDRTMTSFFQGLTRSSSLKFVEFIENGFGVAGVQRMVPFLHNSKSLKTLFVNENTIGSEGFNALWRALRDSPIEKLYCAICGINAIEIDMDDLPKQLVYLNLYDNDINTDDCRELAKMLRGGKSTLRDLRLGGNRIDDEGVAILASALQKNTSLERLHLDENEGMTAEGLVLLLTLVCDISSIKATLQSNHTLIDFGDVSIEGGDCLRNDLSDHITHVLAFNQKVDRLVCGEGKVIALHL
ncbi:leucine-rich repeat protein [Skeletonema marinoi]|uniref:Leucine-rich repeat protein n=1 Tax=Skeletonema marinoi TaxID=267567 RepID=A0AAD8YGT3_9STRA|nr:leucine-rich repeat protein [Skeletonema marinoi]